MKNTIIKSKNKASRMVHSKNVSFPKSTTDKIKELASVEKRSFSNMVVVLVEQALQNQHNNN